MLFSIITPTHKRADKLARAVASVQAQTYNDWEMIIVNDSPNDDTYLSLASSISDPRIHYHINHTNSGVNFTRNYALDQVSTDSKWIIFLDDDDYLSPEALQTFYELALLHGDINWFITNRAYKDGTPLTKIKYSDRSYSYIRDCLLLRQIRGDATHAIRTSRLYMVKFSKYVKQGEEWIFYYELALLQKMFYHNHNSTITDGYDKENGLNFRKRNTIQQLNDVYLLTHEGISRGFSFRITFWIYIFVRIVRAFIKKEN